MRSGTPYALALACCATLIFVPIAAHCNGPGEVDVETWAELWLVGDPTHQHFQLTYSLTDFNGDGIADLLVDTHRRGGSSNRTDIILGAPGLEGTFELCSYTDVRIASDSAYYAIPVGDVNGDSLTDIGLYCRHLYDPPTDVDAYLIFGKPVTPPETWDLPDAAEVALRDVASGSVVQLWGAGDINGDGYADLGVLTDSYSVLLSSAGMSGLIDVNTAEVSLDLTPSHGMKEWSPRLLPDINGDGCAEILMNGEGESEAWEARIWLGQPVIPAPMRVTPDDAQIVLLPKEPKPGEIPVQSGAAIITAGEDVSGDGIGDVFISLRGSDDGDCYVVFGQAGREARVIEMGDADVTFKSPPPSGSDSLRIALAADADDDGVADVLVEEWVPVVTYRSSLFSGGPGLGGTRSLGQADLRFSGGYQPRCAGDFNGDGHNDLVFRRHSSNSDDPQEFAVVYGPFFPSFVQPGSARGGPGELDVPVRVSLESTRSVKVARLCFTLTHDTSTLLAPEEGDVSTGIEGMNLAADTSLPGEVTIELVSSSGEDVTVTRHEDFAVIEFDVIPSAAPFRSPLGLENLEAENQDGRAVRLFLGAAASFYTEPIMPSYPEVFAGDYIHFTTTLEGGSLWWAVSSASGGHIDADTGVYQAGPTADVTDVVQIGIDRWVLESTSVTVIEGERPIGSAGPAASLDVDGGGVALSDVLFILRYALGMGIMDPGQREAADFDCDGKIGLDDAINALKIVVGLTPTAL